MYIPLQGTDTYPSLRERNTKFQTYLGWGHVLFQEGSRAPTSHAMVVGVSGNVATEDVVQLLHGLGATWMMITSGKVWGFFRCKEGGC